MTVKLSLKPAFECVFLINGKLSEGGSITLYGNEVCFITVLPLYSALLPYTVKLVSGKVQSCPELASVAVTQNGESLLVFQPRYAFVYAPLPHSEHNVPLRFFNLIKKRELSGARELLTNELSEAVSDTALTEFFDGYSTLLPSTNEECYLINENGVAHLYRFTLVKGKINDVCEQ